MIEIGHGIQNDPYIVQNWAEFIEAIGTDGAWVEFPHDSTHLHPTSDTIVDPNKLYMDSTGQVQTNVTGSPAEQELYENTFILDANDYVPEGLTSSISMICANLNGYGGTIKNVYADGVNAFSMYSNVNIQAVAFLNNYCKQSAFIAITYRSSIGTGTFIKISGEENANNGSYFLYTSYYNFIKSSFNIKCTGNNSKAVDDRDYVSPCTFILSRINIIDEREYQTSQSYFQKFTINGCYITGRCNKPISINANNYSMIDITAPSIYGVNSSSGQYIFINIDKTTNGGYCVEIHTEDITNAATLSSLGFPIET